MALQTSKRVKCQTPSKRRTDGQTPGIKFGAFQP